MRSSSEISSARHFVKRSTCHGASAHAQLAYSSTWEHRWHANSRHIRNTMDCMHPWTRYCRIHTREQNFLFLLAVVSLHTISHFQACLCWLPLPLFKKQSRSVHILHGNEWGSNDCQQRQSTSHGGGYNSVPRQGNESGNNWDPKQHFYVSAFGDVTKLMPGELHGKPCVLIMYV